MDLVFGRDFGVGVGTHALVEVMDGQKQGRHYIHVYHGVNFYPTADIGLQRVSGARLVEIFGLPAMVLPISVVQFLVSTFDSRHFQLLLQEAIICPAGRGTPLGYKFFAT